MIRPTTAPPPSTTPFLVELVDLAVSLNGVPVLKGCNLTLLPGEALGVVGPNGAGKSTLLATVATFIPPGAGAGTVLGAGLGTPQTLGVRSEIAWSGHLPALFPDLTLGENLGMYAQLSGRPATEGLAALHQVGLGDAQGVRVEKCSNGMRRRADLARLLIGRPRLVLLDEPDAGLDRDAVSIVTHLIRSTTTRKGGVVCVSHDTARLSTWVDRVIEIKEGAIA